MTVALYVRVSTQEQAQNGNSIDEQTERLKKYADAMGWYVFNVYTDAGFSGANTDRPALQRMIRDIRTGKIEKVLVYKLDRLSRSQKDTLLLIEDEFLKHNTDFVSMSENFDTATPFGRAMIGILAVFAQLEREQIKERMKMGKDARAKKGNYFGSSTFAPIGYSYENGELKTVDFERIQIEEAFQLAAQGASVYSIAKIFNEKGYTHRYGTWNERSLWRVLTSRYYIGGIKYDGEWYDGCHEGFIDEQLFESVQKIMKLRSEQHMEHNRRAGKATTYLGGFLECAQCGAKYGKILVRQKRKDGSVYEYAKFTCHSRTKRQKYLVKDPNCKNKIWDIEELTNIIFSEIKKLAFDPNYIARIKASAKTDERPLIIEKEIKRTEEQVDRLMDLYADKQIPVEILQEKIHVLNNKKIQLESELEAINSEIEEKMTQEETVKVVKSFEEVLERGDFEEIRTVLAILIDRILIDNDDITILWNFS